MTECKAEQSYPLNDAQKQRLVLEALLGEYSPSWLVIGATVQGVTDLARFHDALLELSRVYPVLRTEFVTTGPRELWSQQIRSCQDIWQGKPPIFRLPTVNSWAELVEALRGDLESRNPHFRYAAAYGHDQTGRIRVVFAFDHMICDVRSIDLIMAYVARNAEGEVRDNTRSCRCGSNEFADYVNRTAGAIDGAQSSERYQWAFEVMLAARSPHAYVSLPVAKPLSIMDVGSAGRLRSRFVTDARGRYRYTPFAAFVSALAVSLRVNFESPTMFYTPALNRAPAEMDSIGWFAGTPIMPIRSSQIMPAIAVERIVDKLHATSEVMTATTETMRDGHLLTTVIHRKLTDALGGRSPFTDCLQDSLPYMVLAYADRVRERTEWTTNGVVVRKVRLPISSFAPTLVPPGYIFARLIHEKKGEWSVEVDYETERYEGGAIETLMSSMERYLRQLL